MMQEQPQQEEILQSLKLDLEVDYRAKAENIEVNLSSDDRAAWFSHPLTQSMQLRLRGDLADILMLWMDGAYTDGSDPVLYAMKTSKAVTQAQTVHDLLMMLDRLRKNDFE